MTKQLREVMALAWPIAAAMLGETAIGLVDTKLVGGLGPAALGGVGIATTLMYLCFSLAYGLARGVKIHTAHAVGRGAPEEGTPYALGGLALGAALGAGVFLVSRDIGGLLVALRIDPLLHEPAQAFFGAIGYGAPATCMLAALVQHRQGLGDTRTPMVVGLAGNVLNAVLSYGLIYGRFGLPALGVRGGGYGTAITEWAEVLAMVAMLRPATAAGAVPFSLAVRRVCELGVPTGLHFAAEMLAFTTFTAILGALGGAEIAAHQVALAIIRVSFLPGVAVGEAASALVGQSLGRRDLPSADAYARGAVVVGVGFMAVCGVAFALFGASLAASFTNDAEVAPRVTKLLLIAAVFQVLDAVNIVLRGALRGAKDVRAVALIGIAVVWVCVPGAALVLGRLAGWGAAGGWCGFILETTLSAGLFWRRWVSGSWRKDYEGGAPPASDDEPALPGASAAEA